MVAGRVKAVMGFQRSPATPKSAAASSSRKAPPAQAQQVGSVAGAQPETPRRRSSGSPASASAAPAGSGSKTGAFARSFGVYFPRSSAQVQPARATPEVGELVRLVEELQERESRLRTELLEQKILKETVAIVPFLETELAAKSSELGRCKDALTRLESENARLRAALEAAVACSMENEQRILEMERQMTELRKRRQREAASGPDDCWSSASSDNSNSSNAVSNSANRFVGKLFVHFVLVGPIDVVLLFRYCRITKPTTGALEAPSDTPATAAASTAIADRGTPERVLIAIHLKQRKCGASSSTSPAAACG
ncbi:hypothetical protein GUJ93_ZPchr0217g6454 [Zizania palustris]|uniref:Uncharacterized protein n=1 Tax=Zizania palustris TaxID=103762 RepID=A0A8J5UUJ9_ZIZPA|nr:hypothetical protein GUJ93_ZPchr0217g6454 [Zizania palustris]